MNEMFINDIENITKDYDEKRLKKLHIESLKGLGKREILFENQEMRNTLYELKTILSNIDSDYKVNKKVYLKMFNKLKEKLAKEFDLYETGATKGKYAGYGLVFGLIFGSVFTTINPALIGIGMPIGLIFGSGIGTKKEKALFEAGKVY